MKKLLITFAVFLVFALLLLDPKTGKTGVYSGLLLSGRVLIPSLFMFSFVVIFCVKAGVVSNFRFLNKFSLKLLGLDYYEFFILILSLLGGYPIGVKLLNEAVRENNISKHRAGELACCFISSGPGFAVSVIGDSFLKSKQIGYILFFSQVLSALFLCKLFIKRPTKGSIHRFKTYRIADSFVKSVADTSSTVINVSAFVIFFSFFTQYFIKYGNNLKVLSYIPYFLEVTNAVTLTRNVYFISFLLGFAGISVMCQVISIADSFSIKPQKIFIWRVFSGLLAFTLTKLFMQIFKVNYPTISTNQSIYFGEFISTPAVAISLLIMLTVFMISILSKKYAGKILEDMV